MRSGPCALFGYPKSWQFTGPTPPPFPPGLQWTTGGVPCAVRALCEK